MSERLEEYALIGDCQSAALVSRRGSIDWLCWPRFDSEACFAALLGGPEHGRWLVAPRAEVRRSTRRYLDGTLILETTHEVDGGSVRVLDLMPPRGRDADLLRLVVGVRGEVPMRMELVLRMGHGCVVPWVRQVEGALNAIAGPDLIQLVTPVATHGENLTTVAEFVVREGERVPFLLTWFPSHRRAPTRHVDPSVALHDTEEFWRGWSSRFNQHGDYSDAALRSLITLKALTFAPTGGIVAAPTTSLPECLGGSRNWDYRFCWIRDATFTLYALTSAGYADEAAAWREWLLRAVAGTPSQLQTMYGIAGERRLPELELDWLPGYEGSRPVRIGNAAAHQLQLDVWGELMDSLHVARQSGMPSRPEDWSLQRAVVEYLEDIWQLPDEGIWEIRGERRAFTHSKVMAWVALDRAIKGIEQHGLAGPLERWKACRERIFDSVCRDGYDAARNTFVQHYGSRELDASLLMLPLVGFLPPQDPRIVGTVKAIEQDLLHDGFVARYRTRSSLDGLPEGEGVFLPCSFWLADNYFLQGREAEARQLFEKLLGLCNDVGLLAEEYDPVRKRLLGNFPQAFSHVSLANTARTLASRRGAATQRPVQAKPG
ncbi:MAG TPA: glycoside hydrolase family 15 protein [Polyangiaceae bacterium]|nr:glycoside hydrolase family 15 protein [Polyangiaceae bacterium]